jgi:hypothetical protein
MNNANPTFTPDPKLDWEYDQPINNDGQRDVCGPKSTSYWDEIESSYSITSSPQRNTPNVVISTYAYVLDKLKSHVDDAPLSPQGPLKCLVVKPSIVHVTNTPMVSLIKGLANDSKDSSPCSHSNQLF